MPRVRAALATLLVLAVLGCWSGDESPELEPRPPASAPEPEVVAPAGLLAELRLEHPAAAWKRLRTWGADATRIVPGSLALAVATVAGLPPLVAGSVDEDAPLVGAVLEHEASVVLVVGVRVRSGRELVAQLTAGSKPPFGGRSHGRTVVLAQRREGRGSAAPAHEAREIVLGIHGDHLLLGTDERAIVRAGGFVDAVARRRSASPALATVPRAALSGPMSRALRHWWSGLRAHLEASDAEQRARHGGRAPDFGDPTAVLVGISALVDDGLAILESTREVRIFADLFAVPPRVRVELEPLRTGRARQAIVSLAALDLKPLLDLPAKTAFAVLVPALPNAEAVSARAAEVLGERMGAAERRRMTDGFSSLRSALGGPVVLGWISAGQSARRAATANETGETGSAFVRAPLNDRVAFNAAVRQGVRLLSTPAFARPIAKHAVGLPAPAAPAKPAGWSSREDRPNFRESAGRVSS